MEEVINYLQQFNLATIILRLVLAVLVGGVIGNERGRHGSAAGLRTHILVCIGSAMSSLTGYYVFHTLHIQGDVLRLAAQVVSGIGFLGAGMIIVRNGNMVTGLTTAAGMWATSAIGIALGYGFYTGALVATFLCFFTAAFLTRLEKSRKKSLHFYVEVEASDKIGDIADCVLENIDNEAVIESVPPKSNIANSIGLLITVTNNKPKKEIRQQIEEISGVRFSISD